MIQTSRFDNIHILLWLVKDTCWMLEWKIFGTLMIVPTIGVAVYIAAQTTKESVFWINLAICFWITANAFWMVAEFTGIDEEYRHLTGIPFGLGLLSVAIYYTRPDDTELTATRA